MMPPQDIDQLTADREADRLWELAACRADETAEAALAGNLKRAGYLEYWSRAAMRASTLARQRPLVTRFLLARARPFSKSLWVPPVRMS